MQNNGCVSYLRNVREFSPRAPTKGSAIGSRPIAAPSVYVTIALVTYTEGETGVQGPLGSWWSVEAKPLLGGRGQSHRFLRRFDIHPKTTVRLTATLVYDRFTERTLLFNMGKPIDGTGSS